MIPMNPFFTSKAKIKHTPKSWKRDVHQIPKPKQPAKKLVRLSRKKNV